MNSYKPMDLFGANQPSDGSPPKEPWVTIEVPGRLPSWNEICGMEHWARYQLKDKIQESFLYELRASASDSSMMTTSAKSIMLTAAATLDSYRAMRREQRALNAAKKRRSPAKLSTSGSKSSKSKVPF